MCWSIEASFVVATAGIAGTTHLYRKKDHPFLWLTVGWFSLMELLQAFTYLYIGSCENPNNQMLTLLGAYHIALQPIFVCLISLYFVHPAVRSKISPIVIIASFAISLMLLVEIYPWSWAAPRVDNMIYGKTMCAAHGAWHIAWYVPTSRIFDLPVNPYLIGTIIIPLLIGSWKFTAINYTLGFLFGTITGGSPNEAAAIWCLVSFGYLLMSTKTKLRNAIYVNKWYFWEYPKFLKS